MSKRKASVKLGATKTKPGGQSSKADLAVEKGINTIRRSHAEELQDLQSKQYWELVDLERSIRDKFRHYPTECAGCNGSRLTYFCPDLNRGPEVNRGRPKTDAQLKDDMRSTGHFPCDKCNAISCVYHNTNLVQCLVCEQPSCGSCVKSHIDQQYCKKCDVYPAQTCCGLWRAKCGHYFCDKCGADESSDRNCKMCGIPYLDHDSDDCPEGPDHPYCS